MCPEAEFDLEKSLPPRWTRFLPRSLIGIWSLAALARTLSGDNILLKVSMMSLVKSFLADRLAQREKFTFSNFMRQFQHQASFSLQLPGRYQAPGQGSALSGMESVANPLPPGEQAPGLTSRVAQGVGTMVQSTTVQSHIWPGIWLP